MSRVVVIVLWGLFVVWAVNGLFTFGDDSEEYTSLEMEMSRKMKGRMEKEKMAKGSIKVMQESSEPISVPFERPLLDKEVGNSII